MVVLPGDGGVGAPVPLTMRIKSVSATGFQALIVVPPGPTVANRSDMAVSYMAVLPGVHTLPDGKRLEAGRKEISARQIGTSCKAQGVVAGWDVVSFQTPFFSAPAVVANLQTANNEKGAVPRFFSKPWLTLACHQLSKAELSVALESAETSKVGDVSLSEQMGYVAMEVGHGSFDTELGASVTYSAVLTGTDVKGVDDGATEVGLGVDLMTSAPLVVASQTTRNGENGGWLRLSSSSSSSVSLHVDEDVYCDRERAHTGEVASILAWSTAFAIGPMTTTTTTTIPFTGSASLQVGEVTLRSGVWTSVAFTAAFADIPVVVLAPSGEGGLPASVRIKGVTNSSFQAIVATPPGSNIVGSPQIIMTVSFMAMPAGASQLQGRPLRAHQAPPPTRVD